MRSLVSIVVSITYSALIPSPIRAGLDLGWSLADDVNQRVQELIGISQEFSFPVLSADMDGQQVSLDRLSDDALLEVCSHVSNFKEKVKDTYGSKFWQTLGWEGGKEISALQSLSMTNTHLHNLTKPTLFSKVKIEGDWSKGFRALKVLDNCPAILDNVKSFSFQIFTGFEVGPKPPENMANMLATILMRMPKLKRLIISLPEYHTEAFAAPFMDRNVSLDTVKVVGVGAFCDFVIGHCPDVQTVSTIDWTFLHSKRRYDDDLESDDDRRPHASLLIKAAGEAKNVSHFELIQSWSGKQVQQVLHHLPELQTLGMPGGNYEDTPDSYLHIIGQFTSLRTLILADAASLNVGFDPPWCGNAYMGPGGAELAKRVEEEGLEAEKLVAKQVFEASKYLQTVWIGDHSEANARRDGNGEVIEIDWVYHSRQKPLD